MDRNRIVNSLLTGFALLFAGASLASAVVHPPDVDLADFDPSQNITNQYFPQPEGRLFVYERTKDGVPTR